MQIIQERQLRQQHVPQPHLPLHLRHGCSANSTTAAVDKPPWQLSLREHASRGADGRFDAGLQFSTEAQAVSALRAHWEKQVSL